MKAKADDWYVYIIECENGKFYTGIAKDVESRFETHKSHKGAQFTKRNPVKRVIYKHNCGTMGDALRREVAIKKLSHKDKELLINQL